MREKDRLDIFVWNGTAELNGTNGPGFLLVLAEICQKVLFLQDMTVVRSPSLSICWLTSLFGRCQVSSRPCQDQTIVLRALPSIKIPILKGLSVTFAVGN
jgi:hypothetical protein